MAKKYRNRKQRKRLSTKHLLLILTGVCAAFILGGFTLNIKGGPLNSAAGFVFVPMQTGINNCGTWLAEKASMFETLKEVQAENEELKQKVEELTTTLNTNKLERYELEEYRELLGLSEKFPSYEKVAASVIAKDPSNWFSTFTIDKGTKDGIEEGMNVIAGSGLVGIVVDTGAHHAQVRSIINDLSKVSGMVSTTQDLLTVSGNLKTMNSDKVVTFNSLRDEEDKVSVNDPVVTSYVSDMYQEGILIGYITSLETNANNLTKSGTITPAVDFEHLQNVLVIIDKKSDKTAEQDDTEQN